MTVQQRFVWLVLPAFLGLFTLWVCIFDVGEARTETLEMFTGVVDAPAEITPVTTDRPATTTEILPA